MPSGTPDLGPSLSDFLVDLVGGNSNPRMNGAAIAEGFDPRTQDVLDQIRTAIQKSKDTGPQDVAASGEGTKLGDAAKVALYHRNHLSLLNSLNEFYSKKYGQAVK